MHAYFPNLYTAKWGYVAVAAIGALACFHFAISVTLWVQWWRRQDVQWGVQAWTAVAFLIASVIVLTAAVLRRRWSVIAFFILLLSSAATFVYDVANERYQARVTIATTEYWDSGGKQYFFLTWFWYG